MRLNAVIICSSITPFVEETIKRAQGADRVIVVPGKYFGDASECIGLSWEELEEKNLHPCLKIIKMHARWKNPAEKMNIPLHHGSLIRHDWYVYLREYELFNITEEFKKDIGVITECLPLSTEILIPTIYWYKNYMVEPDITFPPYQQSVLKFINGLHCNNQSYFINELGINMRDDQSCQVFRTIIPGWGHYIDNYRLGNDNLNPEREAWYKTSFKDFSMPFDPEPKRNERPLPETLDYIETRLAPNGARILDKCALSMTE